jgi:hypothetical protein
MIDCKRDDGATPNIPIDKSGRFDRMHRSV